jgi:hypothetical protein
LKFLKLLIAKTRLRSELVAMNPEVKSSLKSFLVELVVYAGLVTAYFLLVLNFLGPWLKQIFTYNRRIYAGVALGLIICQGFVLEALTRFLLESIKRGRRTR